MGVNQRGDDVWSIILAGGEGSRLQSFIESRWGYPRPKQYCAFLGPRSMLQHTWERATRLTDPSHLVTVVAEHHRQYVLSSTNQDSPGQVIFQPHNRGTAPGLFLALTYIRAKNPRALVACFPADHFVFPQDSFVATVRQTLWANHFLPDHILLLGVGPTSLDADYGLILPGGPLVWSGHLCVRRVHTFLEKPHGLQGLRAISQGGLWSTFIMTAKVETLWRLGWKCFPEVMEQFKRLEEVIGTPDEIPTLEAIYGQMPTRNFSSDLIQKVPDSIGVIELKDVQWSDWGRPERILETLQSMGKDTSPFQTPCPKHDFVEAAK